MRALFDDPRFDECLIKAGKMTMEGDVRPNHLILICLPFYRGEILEHNPSVVSNSIFVDLFFFKTRMQTKCSSSLETQNLRNSFHGNGLSPRFHPRLCVPSSKYICSKHILNLKSEDFNSF